MAIALGNSHWSQVHQGDAVVHPIPGKEMEYMALKKYPRLQPLCQWGFGSECGRLFQGIRDIPGTNTCFFIKLTNIPKDIKITYGKIVCDYKPHKIEKERVRLTVNGDKLDYSGDVATSAADITTFRILINITLSTEDAAMMMMDIKKLLYGHSFATVWVHENVVVMIPRRNSPNVQPQRLSCWRLGVNWNQRRHGRIETIGITRQPITANSFGTIWILSGTPHPGTMAAWNAVNLFLTLVNDFAVKYVGKQHADHLRHDLLKTYELTTDWAGTVYSCMTLKWDYKNRTCDISMPGYVSNVLSKFQHDAPKHPQHTPYEYVTPVYGAKTQYATKYETPPLTAKPCLTIQKVTRSVLYYARAVNPTVIMPLNDIATEQTKATEKTQATTNQLLDYLATRPDATIRYHASDMIFHIHSDASYLSVSNARSRLGGLFFLGNKSPEQDTLNGSILNVAFIIKNVVVSTAESEVGAWFHNTQSGAPLRVTLTELGHTKPPTPLRTDNSTAKQSNKKDQKRWTCDTTGWPTESAKNNLPFIGDQDVKI
jgi:hypothetical protein